MNYGQILYVDFISYANGIYIAANNASEPKAAMVSGDNVADDGRCWSDPAVMPNNGRLAV
jgi:hypothetical protein